MSDMMIIRLAKGHMPTDDELASELYEICDREHSSCNYDCPVYFLNNGSAVNPDAGYEVNQGCDCFKSGKKMLAFIRSAVT